jgi:hypothetical protein
LDAHGIRIKLEKCEFYKTRVTFLGHVVSITGIEMDQDKIRTIQEWPTLQNLREVQGFLGFVNFNRRFIKDYSRKAIPLTRLSKRDIPFKWGINEQQAFEELKEACIAPPALINFQSLQLLRIETDASDLAIGACIT